MVPPAIVVKETIDLNGNGLLTDSYNSADPAKSTNGKYDPSKYAGDSGDVFCTHGLIDALDVFDVRIYGKLHTEIDVPVNLGSSAAIGSHAWQAGNSGIQPGWLIQNAEVVFPDTSLPDTSTGFLGLPPGATIITVAFTYYTNSVTGSSTFPSVTSAWSAVSTNKSYITNSAYHATPTATNFQTVSTLTYPGSQPDLTTNGYATNTVAYPDTAPFSSITTNFYTTVMLNQAIRPVDGTYIPGSLVQRPNGHWDYVRIIGIASYSYQLPLYTYTLLTYVYANYTYNYFTFTTNTFYQTNIYDHVLAANTKYVASALTGKTYLAGPNVMLVLTNGLNGTEQITWAAGAYLTIYSGGTSVGMAGNNCINPNDGYAGSLNVYCAPSVTNFVFNGNCLFTAMLIAPNADIALNGGGNSVEDFCGMIMGKSIKCNGPYAFHLDEAIFPFYRTPAASLSQAITNSIGSFQFSLQGVPKFRYTVEASTNFSDWLPVATNTSPFTFTDPDATNFSARFYRAVYSP